MPNSNPASKERPAMAERFHEDEYVRDLGNRVSGLESEFKHVVLAIESTNRKVDALSASIGSKIDMLVNADNQYRITDWRTLASWAAVLIALVGIYTNPMWAKLGENKASIKAIEEAEIVQLKDDSHQSRSLAVLEEQYKELKEDLEHHTSLEDHPYGVLSRMQELAVELSSIKSNRFDASQGALLEAKLGAMQKEIDVIKTEQDRRAPIIYGTNH